MTITIEDLKERLEYNPDCDTYVFKWKHRQKTHLYDSFNEKCAGKVAGGIREDGYIILPLKSQTVYLHRLAYMFYKGLSDMSQVPDIVDHKDRNVLNNREDNLRDGTGTVKNQRNRKTIGKVKYKGVDYSNTISRYRARIVINDREVHLVTSESPEECGAYYKACCKYLGTETDPSHKPLEDIVLPIKIKCKIDHVVTLPPLLKLRSEYTGVVWNKKQQLWNSIVVTPDGNVCVGSFSCEEQAAQERDNYILNNNLTNRLSKTSERKK